MGVKVLGESTSGKDDYYPADKPDDKVVALLYLLVRDHLPAGELIKVIQEIGAYTGEFKFTNKHILSLAQELEVRLRGH